MNRPIRNKRPIQRFVPETRREELIDDETDSDEEMAELIDEIELVDSEPNSSDEEFVNDVDDENDDVTENENSELEIETETDTESESEVEMNLDSESDSESELSSDPDL